jgi:hypothetical protein
LYSERDVMADDQDQVVGPQAAACTQWIMDTARTLAAEAAGSPTTAEEIFSAVMALGTVSLSVGVALAQHDRAWALAAIRQLTVLQEQLLVEVDPAALPAARQRTAYLDIARRLIAQAPLPAEGDTQDA